MSSKSVIVSAKIVDVDVFSLLPDDDVAYCNFVRIRHGSIVGVYTVKLSTGVGGDERDMLTLAIQHIVEHIAGNELAREVDRSVPAFDDAVVRRRDLHGAEARRKTRTAGILAEERPHLPRRAAQKPRNQESRTLYRTAVERPAKGAASRQTAAAHRMFRQLQPAGGPSGSLVRGLPRWKTRTQGVSSLQHQDRGRA